MGNHASQRWARHTRFRRGRPPCLPISFEGTGRRASRDRATRAATVRSGAERGTSIRLREPGNHGGLPLRVADDGYDGACQTKPICNPAGVRAMGSRAFPIGKLALAAATRRKLVLAKADLVGAGPRACPHRSRAWAGGRAGTGLRGRRPFAVGQNEARQSGFGSRATTGGCPYERGVAPTSCGRWI